ncbi:EamA family transporter [Candidatus Synechococcus calcipolaris G9]|uniref:EamA family transporter n=1 Tax=Candidatus Synechococcus calcipolaris G9 TaxID=1497997 RepID=A0ABT6F3H7_9SYNE|nr:EamA family transporter [Candidatus Synechococcus calcipolaris]MDG2992410.1 EamA family transporter [Candidatus Synechococcus calcipolaris G9]
MIIKWQVSLAGPLPQQTAEKLLHLAYLLLNPWIISGFAAAFLAALSWMAAMTKFPLSYAYPFMSFAFVLVLFLSAVFFKEPITLPKMLGMAAIVFGIVVGSR